MTANSLSKCSSQTLAGTKYPKPSYSKCFPQTARWPFDFSEICSPVNSQPSKLSRQFMEKKLPIIQKLPFSEPILFPSLEQFFKKWTLSTSVSNILNISAAGDGRKMTRKRQGLLGHTGGKTVPKGKKDYALRSELLSITEVTAYYSFFFQRTILF